MIYEKILVAYDGSDQSKEAVHTALSLAECERTREVHVLKVVEPEVVVLPYGGIASVPGTVPSKITNNEREEFEREIADLAKRHAVAPSPEIVLGSPKNTILEAAKEHKVDLIVMGSRGLGPIRGLLGSVSYGVLSHADVPVLIVR